jgi:hypothetical protein
MPRDGGHLILSSEEKDQLLAAEPGAAKFIRKYVGADEFINGTVRWCLWLVDAPPSELAGLPGVLKRIALTRDFRLASRAAATRRFAQTPSVFCQIAQPESPYLLIPSVSSEKRRFIPMGFMPRDVIANNLVFAVPDASLFHFGVVSSTMHMAWVRSVCGRLKSDFRYSKDIVYNNFPWPEQVSEKAEAAIASAAQVVLDARANFSTSTLAVLYGPLSMPPALVKAHQQLDRAVDAAYIAAEKLAGRKAPKLGTDAERVAFLFERYQALTSLLPPAAARRAAPRRKRTGTSAAVPARRSRRAAPSGACPICGGRMEPSERYPRQVCGDCVARACDTNGRRLAFANIDMSGGFQAVDAETGAPVENGHDCWIDGHACRADEHRFGGIVVELLDAPPARR